MHRAPSCLTFFTYVTLSVHTSSTVLHQNDQPAKDFWVQVRLASFDSSHILTESREAISPYDEHAHFSLSSTSSTQPPSYQQWSEAYHNVSPQDPADMYFGSKHEPMGRVSVSPGLETVWAGEGDKEVVMGTALPLAMPTSAVPPEKKPARVFGLRRRLFWILLSTALIIAIGLGVGLGVGLGKKHKDKKSSTGSTKPSDYYIGGALDPAYFSKEGAFNGSGLALASQSFGSGEYGELVLYFQHHSGSIRWQRLTDNGWVGGTASEVVATDAKNSTPLSAVAYSWNGVSTVRFKRSVT